MTGVGRLAGQVVTSISGGVLSTRIMRLATLCCCRRWHDIGEPSGPSAPLAVEPAEGCRPFRSIPEAVNALIGANYPRPMCGR
jgi:hypothetical protein